MTAWRKWFAVAANRRVDRSKRIRFGTVERLEVRHPLASDLADWCTLCGAVEDSAATLDERLALQTPDYIYKVAGVDHGLVVHPSRVAIDWNHSASVDASLLSLLNLTFVRQVDAEYSVYEAASPVTASLDTDTLTSSGLVKDLAPVFVTTSSSSQAVLLDELVVRLTPGTSTDEYFSQNSNFSAFRPLAGTSDQYIAKVSLGTGTQALSVLNSIQDDTRVAWAEPNFYQDWQKFFTPNDPRFGNQWHLHNTGQSGGTIDADSDLPEAWDVIAGGSSNYTIGIIDDGVVTNHPDLNVWVNPGEIANDGIDNDGNGWIDDINGWNFVANNNQSTNTTSSDMHGTSVAGVAAARGNNGIGVAGASHNSTVLSARIFEGSSVASDANIASAIYYAAGRKANGSGTWKSADVLNNSWGGGASSSVINAALQWATTAGRQGKGAPVFVAAGNEFGAVSEPALQSLNIPGVFAVGAINNKAEKSDYSNFGPAVDLVTPSNDTRAGYLAIDTTDRPGSAGYDPSDYTGTGANGFGGTSSATPLASGIAALTLARADQVGVTLTPAQLRSYLRANTDIVGSSTYSLSTGRNDNMGWGRLNAASAVSNLGTSEISVMSTSKEVFSGTDTVSFGATVIGGVAEVTLRVRNQGTSTLNLTSLNTGSGPFQVRSSFTSSSLGLGAATTFVIGFQPTSAGTFSDTLTIGSNDSNETSFTLNLTGTGSSQATTTTLQLGDVAFTGFQSLAPDKVSFVLLKSIASGTVLTVTDNTWTGSALSTNEGTSVITFTASFAAGTQFNYDASRPAGTRWTVGSDATGLSDVTGGNFALNSSGDNLFAYNGSVAPQSGSDTNWVAAFASNSFVAAGGASSASLTLLPTAFTLGDTAFTLAIPNGQANENGAMTSPAVVSGSASQIRAIVHTLSNWTTYTSLASAAAIPPNIVFTIGTGTSVNVAPTGADKLISMNEDGTYTLTVSDFGFSDSGNTPANSLLAVRVSSLPSAGNLSLNNQPVSAAQFVSATDIAAGLLRFTPASNAHGSPYTTWTFQVQDNGGTASGGVDLDPTPNTITFNVTALNDAPSIATSSGSATFSSSPVVVDSAVTITDIDSLNLAGATVSITSNFVSGQDVLAFTSANGITGSYNAVTGVLTLSGSASLANYQAALRSVTYNNTSSSPNTANRTIAFQVSDGSATNNLSNIATRTVTVSGVTALPLFVNSVTPTSTGVTVLLNRPVQAALVNLYDQGNQLGESDVTLSGASTGPVRGSIVFNSTNTGFTFIKTGSLTPGTGAGAAPGILAPDTYTLTLRSHSTNGFADSAGNALRDIGGTVAGNYVTTFSVATPAAGTVIVGIPDFARGYSQTVQVPHGASGLPIVVSNGNNVGGLDLTLHFDPSLLSITDFQTTIPGVSAAFATLAPGIAKVTMSSAVAFATVDGPLTVGNFIATVPNSAVYASKQILQLTNVELVDASTNFEVIPTIVDNALHVAAFFGDVNASQTYTASDTGLLQRVILGINSGFSAYQQADPFVIVDLNHSLSLSAADTGSIQRLILNLPVATVPPLPSGIASTSSISLGHSSPTIAAWQHDANLLGITLRRRLTTWIVVGIEAPELATFEGEGRPFNVVNAFTNVQS